MQILEVSQFRIRFKKQPSKSVSYAQLVALLKSNSPDNIMELRFNNPVGESRLRQLTEIEMKKLWKDVERAKKSN